MTHPTIAQLSMRAEAKLAELQSKGGRDVNLAEEVDAIFREIGVRTVAHPLGWSEIEIEHALHNLDTEYGEEAVIALANGREIRCPAHPEPCSYVRVMQAGCELGYWVETEWASTPDEVMGAILGLASGSRTAETTVGQTGQRQPAPDRLQVSLDGGRTYHPAQQGVRILYEGMPGHEQGEQRNLHVHATGEGLIFDVWQQDLEDSRNVGTRSQTAQELIDSLIE